MPAARLNHRSSLGRIRLRSILSRLHVRDATTAEVERRPDASESPRRLPAFRVTAALGNAVLLSYLSAIIAIRIATRCLPECRISRRKTFRWLEVGNFINYVSRVTSGIKSGIWYSKL